MYQKQASVSGKNQSLSIINHPLKHKCNVDGKAQLETSKKRSIGELGEATKNPEFFAEMQQKNKQGTRRDGKDFLEDEGGKESGKG